jgi:hypothetical protein
MYSYPFKMQLPDWLPSSMALKKNIVLNYLIEAEFTPKMLLILSQRCFQREVIFSTKILKKERFPTFELLKRLRF